MHNDFKDLIAMGKTIGMEPKWYDIHGVPRFSDFKPQDQHNIYAEVVIYYKIICQACGEIFYVCDSYTGYGLWQYQKFKDIITDPKAPIKGYILPFFKQMSVEELSKFVHYGDPPRHSDGQEIVRSAARGCVGETMNCYDIKILEFWVRDPKDYWMRVPELEIDLTDAEDGG